MAKNDILLSIGFKIDKSSIDTRALTDAIAKRLRNLSINKIKISKSAIQDAFKGIELNITNVKISQAAIAKVKAQIQNQLSSLKVNITPKTAGGATPGKTVTAATQAGKVFSPGQAALDGRALSNARAYKSIIEEIATRVTPNALRAQQRYNRAIGQGGISFKELGARVAAITQRFGEYAVAIRVVAALQRALGAAFQGSLQFDEAIQDLAKVEKASADIGSAFGALTRTALATGRGIEEVSIAINEFVRQGKSLGEAAKFAEEALKLANISTLSAAESARLATAAQQVFGVTSEELAQKLGTIAVFADQSATSVTEIGTAFLRAASSAEAAGIGFEQLTGLLAATLEQTRLGASTVGTAFKTLFARTQKFRDEIEELSNSFARAVGAQSAIIGPSDDVLTIFTKIAQIFPLLNAQQKNQIANQVAGVRQTNVFIGALNNLGKAQQLYGQEVDGVNALNDKNEKQLEKLSVRAKNLTTVFQSLAASLAGLSGGEQDGAAGFAGSILDSFTGTLTAISSLTTSLDDVEIAFVGVGSVVKTALLGGLIGVLNVLKGPLISGAKDFFSTTTQGAKALQQSLVGANQSAVNTAKTTANAGKSRIQQLQQIIKSNQIVGQSQSTQVKLLGSITNLLRGRISVDKTIISNSVTKAKQLTTELSLLQDQQRVLLQIANTSRRNQPGTQDLNFRSAAARGAGSFAVAGVVSEGLEKLAISLEKTGGPLNALGADTSRLVGSFSQQAVLLGTIFGPAGLAVAGFTSAISFATRRLSRAFDESEQAIINAFSNRTLSRVNTVPIVRALNDLSPRLSSLASEINNTVSVEKRRLEVTDKVNKASEEYLQTLQKQIFESQGFSSVIAGALSDIEKFGSQLVSIEQDGFNAQGEGLSLIKRRNFEQGDSAEKASIAGGLISNDVSFKPQTEELILLELELKKSQEEIARIQAIADSAIEPFIAIKDTFQDITDETDNSSKAVQDLVNTLSFGSFIDEGNLFAATLQRITAESSTAKEAASKIVEEIDKQIASLKERVKFDNNLNAAATANQKLLEQVTAERKVALDLVVKLAEAEKLVETRLNSINKVRDITLGKQKESFDESLKEADFRNQLAELETQSITTLSNKQKSQLSFNRLKEVEHAILDEQIDKELAINTLKRRREAQNSKELDDLRALVKEAEAFGDASKIAQARGALSGAEETGIRQADALARQDTIQFERELNLENLKNRVKETFDQIQIDINAANDRVIITERERVEAAEEIIAANAKIIEAEKGLGSARASLIDANLNLVNAMRIAADAQASYTVDVRLAQQAALEATGAQVSLADAFDFAAGTIDSVTSVLSKTIASEQLLAEIRSQSASQLLAKVTQLASVISGFAVNFFTASDAQRNQLQQAQGVAQGVAAGDISAAAVPEELRSAVASFSSLIPGLREQIEGFGTEGLGLTEQLEKLRQVSLSLAKDSVSQAQLKTTQNALGAAESQVKQAEEAVKTARGQLDVANVQKQIALGQFAEATALRNIAVKDAAETSFYTDRALRKFDRIKDATDDSAGRITEAIDSMRRDLLGVLRSVSPAGRAEIQHQTIESNAGGSLSNAEINGVINAARREKRAMPAGSNLMLANTSETVLTRGQSRKLGVTPRRKSFAVDGNAGVDDLASVMQLIVNEIRALRSDVATGGVQQINLQVDSQRNINVKGIEGLSQRLERELAGKFASGGEIEALSDSIVDILTRLSELGFVDSAGR